MTLIEYMAWTFHWLSSEGSLYSGRTSRAKPQAPCSCHAGRTPEPCSEGFSFSASSFHQAVSYGSSALRSWHTTQTSLRPVVLIYMPAWGQVLGWVWKDHVGQSMFPMKATSWKLLSDPLGRELWSWKVILPSFLLQVMRYLAQEILERQATQYVKMTHSLLLKGDSSSILK